MRQTRTEVRTLGTRCLSCATSRFASSYAFWYASGRLSRAYVATGSARQQGVLRCGALYT